jgi:SMI1 / KNR4 family (SUKH-1)
MSRVNAVWNLIKEQWNGAGIPHRPGVTEEELTGFEHRYGVLLPFEIRDFYSHVDGMNSDSIDEAFIRFWPLSEIGPVPTLLSEWRGIPDYGGIEKSLPDSESYFVFADHSIWLNVYAVKFTSKPTMECPVVYIGRGDYWKTMTSSFTAFLKRYADNPRTVLMP